MSADAIEKQTTVKKVEELDETCEEIMDEPEQAELK
jgi:hypothetical protein